MDDLNSLAEIEMFNNSEKNEVENYIEDPFLITDTNSSSDAVAKTNGDRNEQANNVDVSSNNQSEDMVVNDSIQVNEDIQNERNLNEINQLESDQRSDVIDLMYANQEAAITNEKLAEELNGNLDVVAHEEEVRTTVEKESTISEAAVDTVITNELCENQSTTTNNNVNLEVNRQTENQKNLFPSPILPLRSFSTSKISIQKLPKTKPTTSAAANEDNTTKNLNGILEKTTSERKRKPDERMNTANTKTTTTRNNKASNSKVRYRQIKIVRLIRQTTTLTFRETYNPASKDYESMTLLSTKKSKEIDSESTECSVITEKEFNDEEATYFRDIDEDNERNFTTSSSTNTSTSDENQHSAMNNHRPAETKKQDFKATRTASKRTIVPEMNSEDEEIEEIQTEKKQNTQISAKNASRSVVSSKTPTSNKKPIFFQSKSTAKKNPLSKRDLNSYVANANNLAESNSKTSSSVYSSSRTPSYVSSSPSIDSIVFDSDQAQTRTRKSALEKLNLNRSNLNQDEKLTSDSLQVKLRRLTYDEMASANLVYKSDESNEISSDSDDTLLNTTTLSQHQQQQQQQQSFRPLRQVTNMKQCSVKLVRLTDLSNNSNS